MPAGNRRHFEVNSGDGRTRQIDYLTADTRKALAEFDSMLVEPIKECF